MFNTKGRCGINAVCKFKQSDFGMTYAIPPVNDELA